MKCIATDCNKDRRYVSGYCGMHYQRVRTHGTPYIYIKQGTRHGLKDHNLYPIWKGIKQRCYNKNNKAFPAYGGRGIILHSEWFDPAIFIKYAESLPNYNKKGYTLDRVDNDRGYIPGNLRFANRSTQTMNQRLSTRNKTGYIGISEYRNMYRATVRIDGVLLYLGDYKDKEYAAYIRDQFALQLCGEGVKFNVI